MINKLLLCFCLFISSINAQEHAAHPSLQQTEYEAGFVSAHNAKLYYRKLGKGVPLIVLHGGPGLDQDYLLPQLYKLADTNLVIFYDQRGSGKSLETKFDENHISVNQFVDDLQSLKASFGLDKFILMGHSWGGFLAMQYAIDHQKNLMGLILVNSAPANYKGQKAFDDEFELRSKDILDTIKPFFSYEDFSKLTADQINDLYRIFFSKYFYNPENVKHLTLDFSLESALAGYNVNQEISRTYWLKPNLNLIPALDRLKVPTLIIHGKEDIIPLWTAEEIKQAMPHAKMVILENCGHFSYIEQPSQFFNSLNEFLEIIKSNQTNYEQINLCLGRFQP